jgi:hypothetical protein
VCYRGALKVFTETAPLDWAGTHMNLGNALQLRIDGERSDTLEESITSQRAALQVRSKQPTPIDWAKAQMNIGNVLRHHIRGDGSSNLEESTAYYNMALQVCLDERECVTGLGKGSTESR